jgi:hypothetical protein
MLSIGANSENYLSDAAGSATVLSSRGQLRLVLTQESVQPVSSVESLGLPVRAEKPLVSLLEAWAVTSKEKRLGLQPLCLQLQTDGLLSCDWVHRLYPGELNPSERLASS